MVKKALKSAGRKKLRSNPHRDTTSMVPMAKGMKMASGLAKLRREKPGVIVQKQPLGKHVQVPDDPDRPDHAKHGGPYIPFPDAHNQFVDFMTALRKPIG